MDANDKILIVTVPAPGSTADGATHTSITLAEFLDTAAFEAAVNALIAAAA